MTTPWSSLSQMVRSLPSLTQQPDVHSLLFIHVIFEPNTAETYLFNEKKTFLIIPRKENGSINRHYYYKPKHCSFFYTWMENLFSIQVMCLTLTGIIINWSAYRSITHIARSLFIESKHDIITKIRLSINWINLFSGRWL